MGRSYKQQRGATTMQWLLVAIVFGGIFSMGLGVAPLYLEHNGIVDTMERLYLDKDALTKQPSKREVADRLRKKLVTSNINYIKADDLAIDREGNEIVIDLKYEVRTKLIGNIDAVVMFEDRFRYPLANRSLL